ncbi:hypothetical protein HYC85_008252 [Camellia sinensis]|uniref:Uncharacterized protein n=1 Tax=Camellia sinensis TaxID=4442 RepID=A0A7J7HTL0_CAMSI|nr:hypothetical protein HYC85_008252 [Camellia sinensis]
MFIIIRSSKQVQQLNKSAWNVNSVISSSTLLESAHTLPITRNTYKNNLRSSAASFLYATDSSDIGKNENLIEGWDLVEHPTFPPPPSQTEDVEHWTRAIKGIKAVHPVQGRLKRRRGTKTLENFLVSPLVLLLLETYKNPRKFSRESFCSTYFLEKVSNLIPQSNHGVLTKNSDESDGNDDIEALDDQKMTRICDKLIDVFMVDKPNTTDWRRLIAFSKEWDNIRPHFYKRCQDRADSEDDPGMKHTLLRLGRKLKEVDDDVQRHNELLEVIKGAPSEIGEIVARHRKDFTKEFFMHLHTVAESYYDNPTEQNAAAKLGNMCLAAVQAYDAASESIEALNAAELKFQDIVNSPSVDAACRKIDNLAEKNQLDSALVLMITKAWSAAKESNMMKDEVKDILYHLYTTARGSEEQLCALKDAFTPGEELEGKDVDCLYTTPEKLHTWIKAVVDAYHFSREGTLIKEARDLMNPMIIKRLEELKKLGKAEDQLSWRVLQNEKLAGLREKLQSRREQYSQGKGKVEKMPYDLKFKYELLESARTTLERNRVEQLEKFYPNLIYTQSLGHMAITSERLHKRSVVIKQICKLFPQRRVNIDGEKKDGSSGQYDQICNARLPRGLDSHSIPSEVLATSLGYMVQLLNLVVHNVAAPALHNLGFAGSCSRIWQRDSYWDACPSSRSNEYPLFIRCQNSFSIGGEASWSDRSSSNFGVASMESERKTRLDSSGGSFNFSSASPHSVEMHQDLQKGISFLKKSVACLTAYCFNSLYLDVPTEASTFESFAKLLATLSSSKEVRSVFSLKMESSKQVQQLNKSAWNVNSVISSKKYLQSSAASFPYTTDSSDIGKNENLIEGWDLVEHPTFPPPPSQTEDVEHWTRAVFIDATKK